MRDDMLWSFFVAHNFAALVFLERKLKTSVFLEEKFLFNLLPMPTGLLKWNVVLNIALIYLWLLIE